MSDSRPSFMSKPITVYSLYMVGGVIATILGVGWQANRFLSNEFADRIGPISNDVKEANVMLRTLVKQQEIDQGRASVRAWARSVATDRPPIDRLLMVDSAIAAYDAQIAQNTPVQNATFLVQQMRF